MTDTQHTPGPWTVAEDDINGQAIVRGRHTEIATCWHHCLGSLEIQMRANARLIAAAPDLLEACQTLATLRDTDDWIATGRLAVKQARDAIAKATGAQS
jgi:hypothetical protein